MGVTAATLKRATALLRAGELQAAAVCLAEACALEPRAPALEAAARELSRLAVRMPATRRFATDYRYVDRATKPRYVRAKYGALLEGRVLDVGADAGQMRAALPAACRYTGIGFGPPPTIPVDLERGLPFASGAFDCVLCLDVLEHVDDIHGLFDELCRVARAHVIVSLPNCYAAFWAMLQGGAYAPGRALKFYGLPPDPPPDRHKWFFHVGEAEAFVRHRAALRGMQVVQIDHEGEGGEPAWEHAYGALCRAGIARGDLEPRALFAGPLWAVLRRIGV